jgi:hypothetical protein
MAMRGINSNAAKAVPFPGHFAGIPGKARRGGSPGFEQAQLMRE